MGFEIKGADAMLARLSTLNAKITGPAFEKALRAGGAVIQAAMEERAPVLDKTTAKSTSLVPGAIRDNITVTTVKRKDVRDPAQVIIGPSGKVGHVARWVEYGHRMVVGGQSKVLPNGKTRGPGRSLEVQVPAHPFLRPAFEASIAEAETAIIASIKQSFNEEIR